MSRLVRRVSYEWDYESYDKHDDIVDHNFSDDFPGLPIEDASTLCGDEVGINLVLVRDVHEGYSDDFNATADLHDRTWCYVTDDGKLPTHFADSLGDAMHAVPQRFFKHLPKAEEA